MGIQPTKTQSERTSEKLLSLEIMRTVCFFAVLLQHLLGAYIRREGVSFTEGIGIGIIFSFSKFAVPAFVSISGYVLFVRYYNKENFSYFPFLKKRLITLLLPYSIWSVVYFFQMNIVGSTRPFGKREFIRLYLLGDVNYHTWYVFLILQFYLCLPVLFAIYRCIEKWLELDKKKRILFLLFLAVSIYVGLMVYGHLLQTVPLVGQLLFTYRSKNFLFYLPYFVLGWILAKNSCYFSRMQKKAMILFITLWTISYFYVVYGLFSKHMKGALPEIQTMSTFTPSMFIYTVLSIVVLFVLSSKGAEGCKEKLAAVFRFLGKHSYSAYLGHAFWLLFCSVKSMDIFGGFNSYSLFYLYLCVVTFLLSYLFAFLLDSVLSVIIRFIVEISSKKVDENSLSI